MGTCILINFSSTVTIRLILYYICYITFQQLRKLLLEIIHRIPSNEHLKKYVQQILSLMFKLLKVLVFILLHDLFFILIHDLFFISLHDLFFILIHYWVLILIHDLVFILIHDLVIILLHD